MSRTTDGEPPTRRSRPQSLAGADAQRTRETDARNPVLWPRSWPAPRNPQGRLVAIGTATVAILWDLPFRRRVPNRLLQSG
jgi:hypothetical protein